MTAVAPGAGTGTAVTVLITTCQGESRIRACLESLAAQTLAPEQFEVLVTQNRPPSSTPEIVAEFKRAHPRHTVRQLEMTRPGVSHARNVGLHAARGEHTVMVDDDDWVSPTFLEALIGAAEPGVIPVAVFGDVAEGSTPENAEPDLDNYLSAELLPLVGATVEMEKLSIVNSVNAGKLIPTELGRTVRYDETLRSGGDFVFWLQLFAAAPFRMRVPSADAIYYRSVRTGSIGRQAPDYDFKVLQRLDCIDRLSEGWADAPRVRRLARGMITAQAHHVRDYLAAFPHHHAKVVAEVRARGIPAFPWPVVNRGLGRDLAVLYTYPPYLDTSGLVAARRLRERGLVTDVISHALDGLRVKDPSSSLVAAEVVDEARVIPGRAGFSSWAPVRDFVEQVLSQVEDLESTKGPYRSVYSRAMAINAHFAAAAVKMRQPDIHWIAEFSDPLVRNAEGEDRINDMEDDWLQGDLRKALADAGFEQPGNRVGIFEWAELVAYALADEIIFTNERQKQFMLGYCRDPLLVERVERVAEVRGHPTLPAEFYSMADVDYELSGDDVVDIAYFGVFYTTRGLTEVSDALSRLSQDERARVRLHVFTDRHGNLTIEVLEAGLADVIRVRPYVPYLQFLKLTTKFDVLLVNDALTAGHHGINPYLPSKISDYRGSGTPVWAIQEPGSSLSEIDTEYSSQLGDVKGALAVLRRIIGAGRRQDAG
ncbi:MAG: glycosyl transferase family protein [Marmoricola sp.]|nr:glycosyl transferase family protein [Marmoricola sp.]